MIPTLRTHVLAALLLLAALAACAGDGGPDGAARRVILISCDTLRADRLGAYGYERGTTPNLDALAREGVVFDEAYAHAPWTQPAVSSLLTGLLPEEIGVTPSNTRLMPASVETLAEVLRARGVPSAAVVSNPLLKRPHQRLGDVGVQQGFARYDDTMRTRERNRPMHERIAPDTADAAIAVLEQLDGAGEERFFLWVHFQDPHGPYTPPDGVAAQFAREHPPEPKLPLGRTMHGKGQIPLYQVLDGERRPGVYADLYDAEIRYFDSQLGRVLDWLREAGWYDDALIVFTSDHGESLGEQDSWFCHGENVQREVVRVPLVARFPGGAQPALARGADGYVRDGGLAGHVDVFPTVVEAFGFALPPRRGLSLRRDEAPDRVLGQSFLPPPGRGVAAWAVTDGRHRAVWSDDGAPPRLYDLRADPLETLDLFAQMPELGERLVARWNVEVAGGMPAAPQGQEMAVDPETLRTLQQLGYAEANQ